jgi:hypothetical protein
MERRRMTAFATEWLFLVVMLAGLAAVGGFALVPFRSALPFAALASPLAGLLVMALGGSLGYNVLGLPLATGLLLTAALGLLATAWSTGRAGLRPCWRSLVSPVALALLVAGAVVAITVSATIELGGPGLHYWTGTDHLGYAHVADWIVGHPPAERPRVDPVVVYESWPAYMLEEDPRFGSLVVVALVALLRGLPGAFAYDPACALALSTTVLGVAAVFARGRLGFAVLVLGLLTCHWYDYTRAGFLGKVLGFPSGFMVVGLFMAAARPLRPAPLAGLLLLTAGTAVLYQAEASGLFVGVVGGAFIVARVVLGGRAALRRPLSVTWQHLVVLGLIVVVAVTMRGYVAKTWPSESTRTGVVLATVGALFDPMAGTDLLIRPWEEVRPTLLDLEQAHAPIGMLHRDALSAAILLARVIWVALAGIAALRRDAPALALTLGPLLLLLVLNALVSPFARWTTAQFAGTFYPLMLCAGARLVDGAIAETRAGAGGAARGAVSRDADGVGRALAGRAAGRVLLGGLVALMVVSIGLRLPRFVGVVDRYVGASTRTLPPFSLAELDGLAAAIDSATVRVDVDEPHLSLVPLVELGRRGVDIQWGPSSWQYVAGYRGWPAPEPARPADLTLQSVEEPPSDRATIVYQIGQFLLVRPEAGQRP